MRIVIVGAGAVGSYLAERLSAEGQDIILIEADHARAAELQARLDALVVVGNGASPSILEQARIGDADLMIAVTSSDAANILSCHAAARLGVPRTVARIEDPALRAETRVLGVDFVIDPGEALAHELVVVVKQGGVSELMEFADGKLVMIGGRVSPDAPMAGHTLADLRKRVTGWNWLVAALIHDGATKVARGDTTIAEGDHVVLMSKSGETDEALDLLGLRQQRAARKAMILGTTRLALLTAEFLVEEGIQVVVVDADHDRCRAVAEMDSRFVVVQGDPTDPKVLDTEKVSTVDVVLALTGWDDVNLLGALVAKALGARTAVARFNRFDLVGLLPGAGIDIGVSSRLAAANEILRFVRRGRIHSVATFQDTDAEVIELQVSSTSSAIGKNLRQIGLPRTAIVGGILRGDEAFVPHGDTVVSIGDRLIVFAARKAIVEIEEVFS